jgi:hypothetical protein
MLFDRALQGEGAIYQPIRLSLYAYAGLNPVSNVDPDGRFFILDDFVVGFVTGLVQGIGDIFGGQNVFSSLAKPFTKGWERAENSAQIWSSFLRGSLIQILSKMSWELPQQLVGVLFAHVNNALGNINKIWYEDDAPGATMIESVLSGGGITFGSVITMGNGVAHRRIDDGTGGELLLYQHEYGHYLNSQIAGPAFLPIIGVPSFVSALYSTISGKDTHHRFSTELGANSYWRNHAREYSAGSRWGSSVGEFFLGASSWFQLK